MGHTFSIRNGFLCEVRMLNKESKDVEVFQEVENDAGKGEEGEQKPPGLVVACLSQKVGKQKNKQQENGEKQDQDKNP